MVLLPAPFGPMMAWIVPGSTVKDTSDRALSAPNCTVTCSATSGGIPRSPADRGPAPWSTRTLTPSTG